MSMNHWIFTVTKQKSDGSVFTAREIYETRMKDRFWGLGHRTPNRKYLQPGDRVVFYVGSPDCVFAGTATLASESFEPSASQRVKYSHDTSLYEAECGVELNEVDIWDSPTHVPDLVPDLNFVQNKQSWGVYLQGGIRGVTEGDFATIVGRPRRPRLALTGESTDIESVSQFALEAHLEEFLAGNWKNVPWGRRLRLYETPDSNGRQFPAGTWSIDFLAVEEDSNDLVVIELKRGQTSDATVGQVLRYMGWVQENIAEDGQKVKGLIVCRAVDDALRFAVRNLPAVSVVTYRVDFQLSQVNL